MSVWGTHRVYSWVLELVDQDGRFVQTLDTMPSFRWVWDIDLAARGAGTVDVLTGGLASVGLPETVDWESYRLRLSHALYPAGEAAPIVNPVWWGVPTRPAESGPSQSITSLTCVDATGPLAVPTTETREYGPGAVVTEQIAQLLDDALVGRYAITPHPGQLQRLLSFPPDTMWSTVINQLAESIGYGAAYADPTGVVRLDPYRRPSQRATLVTVQPDEVLYSDTWTLKSGERPNRLVASAAIPAAIDAGVPAQDPWRTYRVDPLDAARRGRWVTVPWHNVTATSEEVFNQLVDDKWESVRAPADYLTLAHAYDPRIVGGQNFAFEGRVWTVTRQEISSAAHEVVTTAREVVQDTGYLAGTEDSGVAGTYQTAGG